VRLPKADVRPMILANDTAITFMESDAPNPAGITKSDREHALCMMRSMRSRLIKALSNEEQDDNGNAK
jgi:hypothetical protein